jgi:hypothetical protein
MIEPALILGRALGLATTALGHLRGVNYFRRLTTTISAGWDQQGVAPPASGTRLLSSAGWWP